MTVHHLDLLRLLLVGCRLGGLVGFLSLIVVVRGCLERLNRRYFSGLIVIFEYFCDEM